MEGLDGHQGEYCEQRLPGSAARLCDDQHPGRPLQPFGPEAFSLDVTFHDFAEVYGIPEHCVRHALRPTVSLPEDGGPGGPTSNGGDAAHGSPYRLYNLDVFSYETGDPFSLYASIPFMQAHGPRRTVGVFFNNATEAYVDVARPGRPPGGLAASCEPGEASGVGEIFTQWTFEAGELDMFVLLGPRPADLLRQYAGVTGRPEMPPLWSLGYHQCRWNYDDEADVRAVNQGFRDHAVPCDVIWLDIEHTRGKRYLTWDRARFPDPGALQEELAMDGRHMVAIVDPHIASDPDWAVFRETMDGRAVRDRHGAPYHGECWPGDRCVSIAGARRARPGESELRCRVLAVPQRVPGLAGPGRAGVVGRPAAARRVRGLHGAPAHLERHERAVRLQRPRDHDGQGRPASLGH